MDMMKLLGLGNDQIPSESSGFQAIQSKLADNIPLVVAGTLLSAVVVLKTARVAEVCIRKMYEQATGHLNVRVESQRRYERINSVAVGVAMVASVLIILEIFLIKVASVAVGSVALGGVWLAAGSAIALNQWLARHTTLNVGPKWGSQ